MPQRDTLTGRTFRSGIFALCAAVVPSLMTGQAKPSAAIPATAPTQSVSDLPSAHPAIVESTPRGESHITWNGANLTVNAGGSALPEIVQQIARETGMKITGGVPDERVFGTYGPAPVQVVMGELFDGLAINMMLVNGTETTPKELVLTTRSGAATPPQVRQVSNDDDRSRRRSGPITPAGQQPGRGFGPQQQRSQAPGGPGATPGNGSPNSDSTGNTGGPPPTPAGNAAPGADNGSSTNNATPDSTATTDQQQSPNGVRTPEQIFEELRKRQQQQQQATPTQ